MIRRLIVVSLLSALLTLSGCGAARDKATTAAPSMTQAPRESPTTVIATSTLTPRESTAAESVMPESDADESPAAALPESLYSDLPQSQTAEGYYVLGDPEAPLTMTHYSDFL